MKPERLLELVAQYLYETAMEADANDDGGKDVGIDFVLGAAFALRWAAGLPPRDDHESLMHESLKIAADRVSAEDN